LRVLDNFPNPDDFEDGESWRNGEFEIFNYGDFELHFSHDILYLIFADFDGMIDAGDALIFTQKWIFEKDTSALNLPYVIDELEKENIRFTQEKNDTLFSIKLNLDNRVVIHFESDESTELLDYQFTALWISDMSIIAQK